MNFQLITLLGSASILLYCHGTQQLEPEKSTGMKARNMRAFLMECPVNDTTLTKIQIDNSFVGKIFLGDLNESNHKIAFDLKGPSLIEVSNEEFVLMYTFKLENNKATAENSSTSESYEETSHVIKPVNNFEEDTDVHTANNVKLLPGETYYSRLKPSDFLKTNDFMHTNPKDFRRDSICTKNYRKDNNKNNANNEYANEEFYGDRNQRENENAFSGKLEMSLNNDEIDNIKSNKNKNDDENSVLNGMGYFATNFFHDKDTRRQRRKKINEHKNDFIKCVGMKNLKKIDHILCTCASNIEEINVDVTESNDEQSDCFQLINNVCLWGPVYNKNINFEMETNDEIRNVNYVNIKSTAFACCDLLPNFYFTLGAKCNNFMKEVSDFDRDNSQVSDQSSEIIKNESDEVIDQTMSLIRSNIENGETMSQNNIHRSKFISSVNSPKKFNFISEHSNLNKNKNNNHGRLINIKAAPFDESPKATGEPFKQRNLNKRQAVPFDKVIYDPHLNIADKMQLINMISPKRPCERNQKNHQLSFEGRRKRNLESVEQSLLTDEELDSALENYEYSDSDSRIQDDLKNGDYSEIGAPKAYSIIKNTSNSHNGPLRKLQKICSQHPCALAMPFEKNPYFRGEIKFLDSNGFRLNSNQIAENICQDHFYEFVLIPFEYANGRK